MTKFIENHWSDEEWARLLTATHHDDHALQDVVALFEAKYAHLEHDLHANKNRYKAIVDAQDDLVCRYDPHSAQLTFVNEAYARFHGSDTKTLIGYRILNLIEPDNLEHARHIVADMIVNPRRMVVIFPSVRQGQTLWYQWSDTPIFDDEGKLVEVQTVGRDVTAVKAFENEQVKRRIEQEQRRIITDFIRDASHEFRTPLTIMRSSVYIARKSNNLDKIYDRLDKIEAQASALTSLVDALVLMARLDGDIPEERLWLSDIQFSLKGVIESHDDLLEGRNLTVTWAKLPNISANHHDLAIAFKELLRNAISHTQAGDNISIALADEGDCVTVTLTDTGAGIPPEILPHVWERFYCGDEARTTRGFGLGLPIVRRVIEAHGGDIHLESQVGQGTRITLRLPLAPPPRD